MICLVSQAKGLHRLSAHPPGPLPNCYKSGYVLTELRLNSNYESRLNTSGEDCNSSDRGYLYLRLIF